MSRRNKRRWRLRIMRRVTARQRTLCARFGHPRGVDYVDLKSINMASMTFAFERRCSRCRVLYPERTMSAFSLHVGLFSSHPAASSRGRPGGIDGGGG